MLANTSYYLVLTTTLHPTIDGLNYGTDITTPGLYGADKTNKNIILEIKDSGGSLVEIGKTEFILTNENIDPLAKAVITVLA